MFVCDNCVGDDALKNFIRDNADAEFCSFCGREQETPIAAGLEDLLEVLEAGFAVDWGDALEYMPFEGDGWAIEGAQKDIWDILEEFGLDLHDDLRAEVLKHFDHVTFAPRYYFGVAPSERLRYGWNSFVEHVTHRSRYLFLTTGAEGEDDDPEGIPVADMLRELGAAVRESELVQPLDAGTILYRARPHGKNESPSTATELGAPPAKYATVSNRMSPHGIPMFYAGRERETALKEVGIPSHLTVGTFETGTGFQVLDLAQLPPVPSVFDVERGHLIEPLRFLHVFATEVSKPIRRDLKEHIEYVPTQIVAEYLRHLYEKETGERVDGIAYRSAIAEDGGSNVVLFIDNSNCVDDFADDAVRKVKLTGFEHLRTVFRKVEKPAAAPSESAEQTE